MIGAIDVPIYKFGNFTFLPQQGLLYVKGHTSVLTDTERKLLVLLCDHANGLLPRSVALTSVWYKDTYYNARSMDVYITRLRKLLQDDTAVQIKNVRKRGYTLQVPDIERR